MKNKLVDLNNYLFEQLERLNDDELGDEGLKKEIGRAKAITDVSSAIINNGNLVLKATKYLNDEGYFVDSVNNENIKLLGGVIEEK